MRNSLLRIHTAQDIDDQVDKVLRGLGNAPPPLSLEYVRALLKLDKGYYSSTKDGPLRELASKLFVAGKQILGRPTLLWEAVKKAELKALYLPDRKQILLDEDLPLLKHRWNESHEIGHSIIPWHTSAMLGDNTATLSQACLEHTESEANYAAGRLLFLRERFTEELNSSTPTLKLIKNLGKSFGNTSTSTMWRSIECSTQTIFGAVSSHPRKLSEKFNAQEPLSYFIRSKSFIEKFSEITEHLIWGHMQSYCGWQKGGPLGETEVVLTDDNGSNHVFRMETFFNSYEALTLGVYVRPELITSVNLFSSSIAATEALFRDLL